MACYVFSSNYKQFMCNSNHCLIRVVLVYSDIPFSFDHAEPSCDRLVGIWVLDGVLGQ